jgi:hypothetical protein
VALALPIIQFLEFLILAVALALPIILTALCPANNF